MVNNLKRKDAGYLAVIVVLSLGGCATPEDTAAAGIALSVLSHGAVSPNQAAALATAGAGMQAAARTQAVAKSGTQVNVYNTRQATGGGQRSSPRSNDSFYDGPTSDGGHYVGERSGGQWHGFGIYTWPDGNKYAGEFRHGKKHGQGTFTWGATGEKYVGEFRDDNSHGQGTLTWADGRKYVGEFTKGELGPGIVTKPNGTNLEVESIDGRLELAEGTSIHDNGQKLVGKWWSEGRAGKGKISYPDGRVYEGEWTDPELKSEDSPDGTGTMVWADGREYSGDWKRGKRHGVGTMVHADGTKQEGLWRDDEFAGRLVTPNE